MNDHHVSKRSPESSLAIDYTISKRCIQWHLHSPRGLRSPLAFEPLILKGRLGVEGVELIVCSATRSPTPVRARKS